MRAIEARDAAAVSEAIARGAGAEERDDRGRMPLVVAAAAGDAAIVRVLLDAGARVDKSDRDGETALHSAARGGHTELLELLAATRPILDMPGRDGKTPLQVACAEGTLSCLDTLLRAGCNADAPGREGPALVVALEHGHTEIARELLSRGADPSAQGLAGSALDLALELGDPEIVRALLGAGARPSRAVSHRALELAVRSGSVEIFEALASTGVVGTPPPRRSIDAPVPDRLLGSVRRLLDVLTPRELREPPPLAPTPLAVLAARTGHAPMLDAVARAGHALDARDALGRDALDHARRLGHSECVELLLRRGLDAAASHPIDRLPAARREAQRAAVARLAMLIGVPEPILLDVLVCPLPEPSADVPDRVALGVARRMVPVALGRAPIEAREVELGDAQRTLLSIADGLVLAAPDGAPSVRVLSLAGVEHLLLGGLHPRGLAPYALAPELLCVEPAGGIVWDTHAQLLVEDHEPRAESIWAHLASEIAALRRPRASARAAGRRVGS